MGKHFFFLIALTSFAINSFACVVELQFEGNVLGQNTFNQPSCPEAMKECESAKTLYATRNKLEGLVCLQTSESMGPGEPIQFPGSRGPITPPDVTGPMPFPGSRGGPIVPSPMVPTKPLEIYGDCHLSDSNTFEPNHHVLSLITGQNAKDIIAKCSEEQERAGFLSSRVLNFIVVGQADPNIYQAQCHIDDDQSFDPNVYSTPVFASSVFELVIECKELTEMVFTAGTSRVMDIQSPQAPLGRPFECHVDDDEEFDYNVLTFSPIFGADIIEAIRECERIQNFYFPGYGSFRVR